ncbi:hypothetical protein PROPEN_00072 [Proteus penneri ATCC 35198]|nr:hypothetical protein PROPEN_00072 [Proteus penneri ATCC 35198]
MSIAEVATLFVQRIRSEQHQKAGNLVQFKLTKKTRDTVTTWIRTVHLHSTDYIFQSQVGSAQYISTRQYNRIFHGWIEKLDLDNSPYNTHSMSRTKPYQIYQKTKNLRVIGHKKLESTIRYLGIGDY